MPRKLLISALLLIMPFSGMRVICLEPAGEPSGLGDHAESGTDCDRICALHRPDGGEQSSCALTADASALMMFACAAVLPSQQPMRAPVVVFVHDEDAPQLYLEPGLAQLSPPPKA